MRMDWLSRLQPVKMLTLTSSPSNAMLAPIERSKASVDSPQGGETMTVLLSDEMSVQVVLSRYIRLAVRV